MPNVNAVLNEQIRRLARREIRSNTATIKKATGHYRRDIAALKRQVASMQKSMVQLRKQLPNEPQLPPAADTQNARLRIDGLKGHGTRLGLSAKDYGKLLGVSSLTIYNWENGKSKPRRSLLPNLVSVRGIGKREALQRLGLGTDSITKVSAKKAPSKSARTRGKFKQTGEESILALLRGGRSLPTKDINHA